MRRSQVNVALAILVSAMAALTGTSRLFAPPEKFNRRKLVGVERRDVRNQDWRGGDGLDGGQLLEKRVTADATSGSFIVIGAKIGEPAETDATR